MEMYKAFLCILSSYHHLSNHTTENHHHIFLPSCWRHYHCNSHIPSITHNCIQVAMKIIHMLFQHFYSIKKNHGKLPSQCQEKKKKKAIFFFVLPIIYDWIIHCYNIFKITYCMYSEEPSSTSYCGGFHIKAQILNKKISSLLWQYCSKRYN